MIDKLTDQSASRRRSVSLAFYFPTLERVETHNTNGRSIITNIIIIIITHWTCKDQPWKSVAKPHRPSSAHQHGRQSVRSAGHGRDSGVVLEREVLAPAQRNLGWLEKYWRVNLSTSRGSVSSVSFSILHVYDPAGLWEVRPVSHLHPHHQHQHHHHCWRWCCAQGFILSWWSWWDWVCAPSHCHWILVWIRTMTGTQYGPSSGIMILMKVGQSVPLFVL